MRGECPPAYHIAERGYAMRHEGFDGSSTFPPETSTDLLFFSRPENRNYPSVRARPIVKNLPFTDLLLSAAIPDNSGGFDF